MIPIPDDRLIVVATQNRHKIKEIEAIVSGFDMEVIGRDEAGIPDVEILEDGETFEENSYKKANEIMKLCGRPTIADDSGLEVDCLDGAPGIYSARFAAPEGSTEDSDDKDNNRKLMRLLEGIPYELCTGRFVSVVTMVFPDGRKIVCRGTVEGHVIPEERGTGGFGYDPMFIPEGYDKTFGQLPQELKNSISHRAMALRILEEKLREGTFE